MIRVGNYDERLKRGSTTSGFETLLLHRNQELSPNKLRTHQGYLLQNYLSFHGLYYKALHVQETQDSVLVWQSSAEVHAERDPVTQRLQIKSAYWKWRQKGFEASVVIAAPNGWQTGDVPSPSAPDCFVVGDEKQWVEVDENTARAVVFYQAYRDAARLRSVFTLFRAKILKGQNVQINSWDGPRPETGYPFTAANLAGDSMLITEDSIRAWLTRSHAQKLSVAACLAVALLDQDAWILRHVPAELLNMYAAPPPPPLEVVRGEHKGRGFELSHDGDGWMPATTSRTLAASSAESRKMLLPPPAVIGSKKSLVVQLRVESGRLVSSFDVWIGSDYNCDGVMLKKSKWACPFTRSMCGGSGETLCIKYEEYLRTQRPDLLAQVDELYGRVLACVCKDKPFTPCHGDVLVRLANEAHVRQQQRSRPSLLMRDLVTEDGEARL